MIPYVISYLQYAFDLLPASKGAHSDILEIQCSTDFRQVYTPLPQPLTFIFPPPTWECLPATERRPPWELDLEGLYEQFWGLNILSDIDHILDSAPPAATCGITFRPMDAYHKSPSPCRNTWHDVLNHNRLLVDRDLPLRPVSRRQIRMYVPLPLRSSLGDCKILQWLGKTVSSSWITLSPPCRTTYQDSPMRFPPSRRTETPVGHLTIVHLVQTIHNTSPAVSSYHYLPLSLLTFSISF